MLEGAGNCLGHAAQQAVVDVGQFDQGDIGGKAERLFHQEEQGIGEQQQHSVDDEISVHASVDFCQVVFCNQLESKVDGSVGQYVRNSCDRCESSLRLKMATSPAESCRRMNSCG